MVLAPIEPVAPRSVMLRSGRAEASSFDCDCDFGICEFITAPDQEPSEQYLPD
jgi:hypothetical protein